MRVKYKTRRTRKSKIKSRRRGRRTKRINNMRGG